MAEMTAREAKEILLNLSWAVGAERRSQIAALIERQAAEIERMNGQIEFWTTSHEAICKNRDYLGQEIERLRDLHRSILWFVEEHKKTPNCKKWMPLIEEKARHGLEKEAEGV